MTDTERARIHFPTDPALIAAAISQLRAAGLTPRDIASALRLDLGAVVEVLRDAPTTERGSSCP